ncbi:MAG: hypothetical protein LH616_04845 [Ilumatobacteraceae bacterium]|nr:hypothetical protein [Ilumatobacteraceae bacterium]
MIAMLLSELTSGALVAASDGGPLWLLALGPAGGGALYFGLWRYYRNTHQSHSFERDTRIEAKPIIAHDTKVDEIKGTKKSGIDGGNGTDHRKRVQRLDS